MKHWKHTHFTIYTLQSSEMNWRERERERERERDMLSSTCQNCVHLMLGLVFSFLICIFGLALGSYFNLSFRWVV